MSVNDRCEQMTAGMRKQADSLLRQAYFRGYKDGKQDAEVRHGKWIDDCGDYECDQCGARMDCYMFEGAENYCPNCGAKMD